MHRERLPKNTRLRLSGTEYIIENCIGYGGSGLVYAAKVVDSELYQAIKELYPSEGFRRLKGQICSENETMARELETLKKRNRAREQRLSQRAERRNHQVEAVLSVCDDAEILMPDGVVFSVRNQYSIMGDLSEKGMPLWQYVSNRNPSIKEILDIMESVLRAYDRLHRDGFLHGDCQMGNLYMLGAEPEREFCGEARIIDFGEAWELTEGKSTEIGLGDPLCSTEGYVAPEILFRQDKLQLTPAADVYSLGYLLLTLADKERLSGYRNEQITYALQTNRNLRKARKEIAKEVGCDAASLQVLNRILVKALETAPEKRFQNAGEMLEEIHHLRDCLERSCEYGVTADTLRHGALVYYEKHRDLFRTEHKAVLAPELGIKKLTIYGRGPDGEERPIQTLLEESQGKDIYIEAPGGAGKTFALSEFFVNMLEDDEIIPLYLDMQSFNEKVVQEAGDYNLVIPRLLAHQYMNDNAAERSVKEIQKLLYEDKRMLLILDNLHKVSETLWNQTIAAVNKLHAKALWLVVAGRKWDRPAGQKERMEPQVRNKVVLCTVPIKMAKELIQKDLLHRQLSNAEETIFNRQYAVAGLPLFFMRWMELLLQKPQNIEVCSNTVFLLYEYFNCVLESKPISNDSSMLGIKAGMLIRDVIPEIAFWYGQSGEKSHTEEEICAAMGKRGAKCAALLPQIISLGVMWEADGRYCFEHDVYEGFFGGMYISEHLRNAVDEAECYYLKKIDCEWAHEFRYYWPQLGQIDWESGEVRCTLDEYSQELYEFFSIYESYPNVTGSIAPVDLWIDFCIRGDILTKPVEWALLAAKQGDAKSQYNLGRAYESELVVRQDYKQSIYWYCKAAEQNHAGAQFKLGCAYRDGSLGIEQDYTQSVYWFRLAAEQGNADAQIQMGLACKAGRGVETNHERAFYWFRLAHKQGKVTPQLRFADKYYYGDMGVAQDYVQAAHCYRQAADQGYARAQQMLGDMYSKGQGVERNAAKAVYWWRLSAEQGYDVGQCNLGWAYYSGEGVEKDEVLSVYWYRLAAEQGLPNAQYSMGETYYWGEGVEKDCTQALEWYRKAAEQGHAKAKYCIGYAYYWGEGVKQDYIQAKTWFEDAANGGVKNAYKFLGKIWLLEGFGMAPDPHRALEYLKKAKDLGVENIDDLIARAEMMLTHLTDT